MYSLVDSRIRRPSLGRRRFSDGEYLRGVRAHLLETQGNLEVKRGDLSKIIALCAFEDFGISRFCGYSLAYFFIV